MRVTLLVQKEASIYAVLLKKKRTVSVSFISFEKYELGMRKNFSENFLSFFLPKNIEYEKNFDVIFRPKRSL